MDQSQAAVAGLRGRVVLIRHGQTRCTVQGRFCGAHEGELTEVGREMAGLAALHPALDGIGAVVSSPSTRAVHTAEAIAAARGLPVLLDERLRELSFGEWEDRLPGDLEDRQALERWESDPALFTPPGGESGLEVAARAVAAVRDAALAAPAVAVVTHKAPVRLVLSFFLGLPPSRYREIGNVAVGSVSHLHMKGDRTVLKAIGDVSHLPKEWRGNPDLAAPLRLPEGAR
ncbi:histidine phosphatase family protein [Kitasatospora sp. HPMI-4]|uniref:histidine phosphatase family protein n=1 Tax=Kitasatospora sp. HPMI-4 TaxID=3448443 RepID=UPI003F19CE1E